LAALLTEASRPISGRQSRLVRRISNRVRTSSQAVLTVGSAKMIFLDLSLQIAKTFKIQDLG